uniref:G_PROTEIN_RECEP_F1_2 domain-containing protein n=1 Tax=Panagrellus redivivus TaxID=6233 RepID=A0A7E4VW77_PANRE
MACVILITPRFVKQKEYVLLALNVLFDALFGLQYLLAGTHLLTVTVTNEYLPVTTRLACYTKLYVQLMIVLTPAMGVIALANALDRLYLITFPGKYHKLTLAYPFFVVGGALLCCVPTTATAFVTVISSASDPELGNCLVQDTIPKWLQFLLRIIRIVTTVVAIPLYLPIIIKIKKVPSGTPRKRKSN